MINYSDYIVYVDESGDHGLKNIDSQYPIFVLAFCVFIKSDYLNTVQALQEFKFKHFGHDIIVLHENEIRKDKGVFKILGSKKYKNLFINELSTIIEKQKFQIISNVIIKNKLKDKYRYDNNPYHIALKFCLEMLFKFLIEKNQHKTITTIVVEQRGKLEDASLKEEFDKILLNGNFKGLTPNLKMVMANKQNNSTGLQIADLVARPIGLQSFKPKQKNRSFEVIKGKMTNKVFP